MSEEIKISRPVASSQNASGAQISEPTASGSKMPWVILGVIVVVLLVVGVLFRDKLFRGAPAKDTPKVASMKASGYSAVFLTNGQVYFGKMTSSDGAYTTMKDIFYLQVVQQPGLQGSGQTEQQQQAQSQISLVKLGNELHGPVDEMKITNSQILFFESMKEDSQVVQAINNYKANPEGKAPAAGQQAVPAAVQQAPAAGQQAAPVAVPLK